jgi:cellulose synthase/poly-beta-1,6-N-acetylglucosamine synthase-like glycosyltransferase
VLTVVGAARQRQRREAPARVAEGATRFAILVPAHDEEAVIADAVASLVGLDYPAGRFEVHVVADNCSDRTADLARAAGASVHERADTANPGKGAALNWLHDRVRRAPVPFDAFAIVDADTTVDAAFLWAMHAAIADGARVAQGFYGVSDSDASAAAGLRAAALACRHHLRPLARNAIGGSCGLFGNGMVFTADVLQERRWSGHLTEDMEFQLELLLDGVHVAYVPGARVVAQMPDDLATATSQNERWELGRLQLLRTYLPPLARRARSSSRRTQVESVDAILDLAVPPLSVLGAAQLATNALGLVAVVAHPTRTTRLAVVASALGTATLLIHALTGLWSAEAPSSAYRSLLAAPRIAVWKVRLWLRVMLKPGDVAWSRTARRASTEGER